MLVGFSDRLPLAIRLERGSSLLGERGLRAFKGGSRALLALAVLGAATLGAGPEPLVVRAASVVEAGLDAGEDAVAALLPLLADDPPPPAPLGVAPTPTAGRHVVQPGESLISIARRNGISLDALVWANNLSDVNVIQEGQTLTIPAVSGKLHTVEAGETLETIAGAHGASPAGIAGVNGLAQDAALTPGQRVLVPSPRLPATAESGPVVVVAAQAEEPVSIPVAAPEAETPLAPARATTVEPTVVAAVRPAPPPARTARIPRLGWPIELKSPRTVISQGFHRGHRGVDIAAPTGTPVKAIAAGVVESTERSGAGYGLKVVVDHGEGVSTWYAHLSAFAVAPGDQVQAGQTIGSVGSSGLSTGPHLHFELRVDGNPIDPRPMLS